MRATAELIAAAGPDRLAGVRVIGVDEHRWAPRRRGTEGFVTLIIDLTPVLDGTGRARLLDMVAGRSAAALTRWLANQPPAFRDQVEVVAMDGFGGYKTAATEVLPEATTVMDPFHVVALAGAKLDLTRQRIQQQTQGHRGRSGDPLYGVRRTLRTRFPLLTSRQHARLSTVFADDAHLAVQVMTWSVYQRIIAAYGHPDRRRGKTLMSAISRRAEPGEPGVVDQDVDVAGLPSQPQRLCGFAQVGADESGRAAAVFDLGDHRGAPIGVAAVHDHRGALRGQLYRGSLADPRRRAGDQRDLAFQIPNHGGACHDYS